MEKFNKLELRQLSIKNSDYDLTKSKKMYNFIIDKKLKEPVVEPKPDGIYFILSPDKVIHGLMATDVDKRNSIAVGVKMGNRFANVVLHDEAGGEEIALCRCDKLPCGHEQFSHDTFWKAMSDWNGEANTNDMRSVLNPDINLGENEYIPSLAQLHLILLNINEINKALVEAEGDPMKEDWYWSSTEYSRDIAWYVSFGYGYTTNYYKYIPNVVRTAIACEI